MGNTIADLKKKIAAGAQHYHEIAATAPQAELRALSEEVEAAQKELISVITKGASPCPHCGNPPTGMEQPNTRGGFEYEIGCSVCPPFEHDDGTTRKVGVRGGMMPSHAVDAWNGGPDFWTRVNP